MGIRCSKVSLLYIKSIIIKVVKLALSGGLKNGEKEMLLAGGDESFQHGLSPAL